MSLATVIPLSSIPTRVSTSQQAGLNKKSKKLAKLNFVPDGADDLALSVGGVRLGKDVFKGEQVKEVTFISLRMDHELLLMILKLI